MNVLYPIHEVFSVAAYEARARERRSAGEASNVRAVERVRRDGKLSIVEHAGFHDFFMPLSDARGLWVSYCRAVRNRETDERRRFVALEMVDRRTCHASDPEFTRYVSTTLATTTFDSAALALFKRLLVGLGKLFAGRGSSSDTSSEVQTLQRQLRDVRFPERMWDSARAMVDEATFPSWESRHMRPALQELGSNGAPIMPSSVFRSVAWMKRIPLENRSGATRFSALAWSSPGSAADSCAGGSVSTALPSCATKRRAESAPSESSRRSPSARRGWRAVTTCGFISGFQRRQRCGDLARTVSSRSRRRRTRARAGSLGVARGARRVPTTAELLAELRGQLSAAVGERPESLLPGFDAIWKLSVRTPGIALTRRGLTLKSDLILIAGALRANGGLDERSFTELGRAVARAASEAVTVEQLAIAYRRAFSDIVLALYDPSCAPRARSCVARSLSCRIT